MKKLIYSALLSLIFLSGLLWAERYPQAILRGDYPDPTIIRDGNDYYMTHSPFSYAPGFLIWHSTDLVNWQPLTRTKTSVKGSAYAPDLVKHNGRYYIYYPDAGSNWVIWSDNILGPWSAPIDLKVGRIDPGHAVGEDGKRYLFLSDGYRVPLSDDGLVVTGKPEKIYKGWQYPKEWETECFCLESPKIVRKGDYFYMISAEGGTAGPATSHMAVTARSRSIDGPWENSPYNPLVHTYSADEQWWSKGHGTLIADVDNDWWVVYHAYENGHHPLGRLTLLEPIEWTEDGWPRLAKMPHPLKSEPELGPVLSDDFSKKELGPQWMSWRDYAGISLRDGSVYLTAKGTSPRDARLLLVTASDHAYELQIEVDVSNGGTGGLVLFYSERAFAGLASDGNTITLYRGENESSDIPSQFGNHFFLKIVNRNNHCDFLASADGKTWMTLLTNLDVSGMHHNNFQGFLALRPALMAAGSGSVKFDNFIYDSKLSNITKTTEYPSNPFGNALIPDLVADPSISEIDGTFYLYATTDGWGQGLQTAGIPVVWTSKDFLNWSFEGSSFPADFDAKYWAPSTIVKKDGRYYSFPTLDGKITAVVADSPLGPFLHVDGMPINRLTGWKSVSLDPVSPIDAEVFVDDDGQAYMVYSRRRITKLNPDLTAPEGETVLIETPEHHYSEGPFLFKRKGVYYYLYTLGGHEEYRYAYMISRTSPLGPWEAPKEHIIARTDKQEGVMGPGHGCFFSPKGSDQWYFIYLEFGRAGTNRQIFADRMHFNADGTIQPIDLTKKGVGALRPVSGTFPNLAVRGQATASSIRPDYKVPPIADKTLDRVESFDPACAIDASNGSRWMAVSGDKEKWWMLDLGESREINRTEAYFVKPTAGHAYKLEYSLDGKSWKSYGGHDEVVLRSPHIDEKRVHARYLRVTILRGEPGLWEFRVY